MPPALMQINMLSRIGFGRRSAQPGLGACQARPNKPWPVKLERKRIDQTSAQHGPGDHAGGCEIERDHDEMEQGIGIHARSIDLDWFRFLEKDQKPFYF